MAYTYPVPTAEFVDLLKPVAATMTAPPVTEKSETAAGEVITRALGPSLWRGQIDLAPDYRENVRAARALIEMLARPGASFVMRDPVYGGPREDPLGAILGGAAPKLTAVAGNGDATIGSLPAQYQFRAGDYFSFTYGTAPVRYALHQIVKDAKANGSGNASGIVVHPPIRAGWTANAAVRLIRPICKAVIVPGSVSEATYGPVSLAGLSFRWQQTLR